MRALIDTGVGVFGDILSFWCLSIYLALDLMFNTV
jgi:hypothetical protein